MVAVRLPVCNSVFRPRYNGRLRGMISQNQMRKLILASASPWRKKILSTTGIPFTVEESGYEEDMSHPLSPRVLAKHLALGKAQAVARRHPDAVVIGADTFAVYRGKLLGKPHTPERATEMLGMLSGKTHTLLTGFAIVDSKTGRHISKTVGTRVKFKKLSPQDIATYVATGEPLSAAGAYVIQGEGRKFIETTSGDHDNVAGLPLAAALKELAKFGIAV